MKMTRNHSYIYPTRNALITRIRARSLLLVLPALLAAYAVAGAWSPALAAGGGGTDGTVDVTADSLGAAPGNVVVFTLTVHNGSQAGWVTVTDNLPPHSTLLDAPGCDSRNGGSVSCSFPMFPYDTASTTVTVQIDSNATCNARLRNTARVHGWASASVDVDVACATP
jgi:hypothetical protein